MARTKQHKRVSSEELADRHAALHASRRRGDHDKYVSTARKGARKATTEVPAQSTPDVPAQSTTDVPAVSTLEVPAQSTHEVPATEVPAQPTPEVPAQVTPEVPTQVTLQPIPEVPTQPLPEVPDHDTAEPSTARPDLVAVEEPLESESEPELEAEVVEVEDPRRPPLQRDPLFPGGPVELSLLRHYPDHIASWTPHTLLGTTDPRYYE